MKAPPARIHHSRQMYGEAVISADGVYRYHLGRSWRPDGPAVAWVMLNPSKADAMTDDATIRRIIGYSRAWGYGKLEVVNLFAMRTTTPGNLWLHPNPVGPENGLYLEHVLSSRDIVQVVCAWGGTQASRELFRSQRDAFVARAAAVLRELYVLRLCASGDPVHPVRQPNGLVPKLWRPSL